jgi:hypothetical protein
MSFLSIEEGRDSSFSLGPLLNFVLLLVQVASSVMNVLWFVTPYDTSPLKLVEGLGGSHG